MNKTKIETCDFTWNPVRGCKHDCSYCYARPIANKIYGNFEPKFIPEKLKEPIRVRKPSKIFVTSMGDLFGDWVPDEWIKAVLMAALGSIHTFQFLTKNPRRLKDFNPWPSNCWVGTTVTNQVDLDERGFWLLKAESKVRFFSHEPLLEQIDLGLIEWPINWAIIGSMTGSGAIKPKPEWVQGLVDQYKAAGVPVFMKNNLRPIMGDNLIQEWPK